MSGHPLLTPVLHYLGEKCSISILFLYIDHSQNVKAYFWSASLHIHEKQLTMKNRKELRLYIEQYALAFSVAFVEPKQIDEINILNASILAMHLALEGLKIQRTYHRRWKPF